MSVLVLLAAARFAVNLFYIGTLFVVGEELCLFPVCCLAMLDAFLDSVNCGYSIIRKLVGIILNVLLNEAFVSWKMERNGLFCFCLISVVS